MKLGPEARKAKEQLKRTAPMVQQAAADLVAEAEAESPASPTASGIEELGEQVTRFITDSKAYRLRPEDKQALRGATARHPNAQAICGNGNGHAHAEEEGEE